MITKSALLRILKSKGYDGDASPADIKTWVADNAIELVDGEGKAIDLDAVLSAKEKKVTIQVVADAGEEVEVVDGSSEAEAPMEESAEDNAEKSADRIEISRYEYDRLKARGAGHERIGHVHAGAYLDGKAPAFGSPYRKAYQRRIEKGKAVYGDVDTAEHAQAWFRLAIAGPQNYPRKAYDISVIGKSQAAGVNSLGGATVPTWLEPELISLKEERGVARKLFRNRKMATGQGEIPRRTGGLTVYDPGENSAITESDIDFDSVELNARQWATLTTASLQWFQDSAIDGVDEITKEIAYAFADQEDQCAFNGDGTSTYLGVDGVRNRFRTVLEAGGGTWATDVGNLAGLVVGAGNAYSELTLANFQDVYGLLPSYAEKGARWVVSKRFWANTMVRLAQAAGGTTSVMTEDGPRKEFEGVEVEVVQVMPSVEANSQVCALLGDFSQGAAIGDVTGSMQIASSDQYAFNKAQIAIRGLQRVAIVVHDVGNYNATAASRVAGPIVGLITAAS